MESKQWEVRELWEQDRERGDTERERERDRKWKKKKTALRKQSEQEQADQRLRGWKEEHADGQVGLDFWVCWSQRVMNLWDLGWDQSLENTKVQLSYFKQMGLWNGLCQLGFFNQIWVLTFGRTKKPNGFFLPHLTYNRYHPEKHASRPLFGGAHCKTKKGQSAPQNQNRHVLRIFCPPLNLSCKCCFLGEDS